VTRRATRTRVLDEIVAAGKPWGCAVRQCEILRLVDLEGQQAVDFLSFDAVDPTDRYNAPNTINNFLRYAVRDTPSCYANFLEILARFKLDERSIVSNVNFFMSVPVLPDGSAGLADGGSQPGSYVELRAERNVLAVLSNWPQTRNPCNGYNPTPIRVVIYKPAAALESV
jgi:uncharacterized protein